jgi:hypothetical protein
MVASHTDEFKIPLIVRAKESEVYRVTEGEEVAAGSVQHVGNAISGRTSISTISRMRTVRCEEYATNAVGLCSEMNTSIFDAFQCKMYERTFVDILTHDLHRILIR